MAKLAREDYRYLITTAEERTWVFDRPVLFLGEWCKDYDRREVWGKLDAIVAAPYGLGQAQKDTDHNYARALEARLFPELCKILNEYHAIAQGERYWRMVLGHWLRRYVNVLVNRINAVKQCLNTYAISGVTIFNDDDYMLAANNSYESIWAYNDDRWNAALYGAILQRLGAGRYIDKRLTDDLCNQFIFERPKGNNSKDKNIYRKILRIYNAATCKFVRSDDAFLINTYIPKWDQVCLQLMLGQMPKFWQSPYPQQTKGVDRILREDLTRKLSSSKEDAEKCIKALLFMTLPVSYLEDFQSIHEQINALDWPNRPKLIFTSNSFDADDVFKIWAASNVAMGAKYIVGQHGNNYGTYRYSHPTIEEITSDRFLTWGWKEHLPQHYPAFNLKVNRRNPIKYDPRGGLLLIEVCLDHRLNTWDETSEFSAYFDDQRLFVDGLPSAVKQHLTIRLHAEWRLKRWNELQRWKDYDPNLGVEPGDASIRQLISQSRLIVHSYDSTGILETLAQNIPTLAFWQNGLEHLRESAQPYYQLLIEAGIIQFSPEAMARKVAEVWDDIPKWWNQPHVQAARKEFCGRYSRSSKHPLREINKCFKSCW